MKFLLSLFFSSLLLLSLILQFSYFVKSLTQRIKPIAPFSLTFCLVWHQLQIRKATCHGPFRAQVKWYRKCQFDRTPCIGQQLEKDPPTTHGIKLKSMNWLLSFSTMNLLKQSSTSAIAHAAISTWMLPSRRGAPFIDMDTTQTKVVSFLLSDKTWLAFSSLRNGIYNRDTVLVLLNKVR